MIDEREKYRTIIGRILQGETQLFLIIVDDHKKLVSRMVWKMVYKSAEREDICQDIFLKVYKNLAKFKFECKLSTWIAQIAYNSSLNFIDKKRVDLYDDFHTTHAGIQSLNDSGKDASQFIEEEDTSRRLQLEMDKLPVNFRTALALFHLEEMKYEEISEIMGLPIGTVKSHIFRGRKILKEILEKKYKREELWL
ncbi:MAG: hypothetical protein DWQ05_20540 [Calditrichaeota bacterium]|nr:MAG: hypothetical protein DWQ05_20540 [Calditrichota bacterium]